jgi:tripartite-type tricarboxylate transporter receptor subunit TctC
MFMAGRSVWPVITAGVLAVSFGISNLPSHAAEYPTRNITFVVPSPPGGGTDTSSRILAPKLAEFLGQNVVIENRPGASGNIGAESVARATPDGYTLLAMISSHVINQSVLKHVPYNLERDFAMISRTVIAPGVLVSNASLPAHNLNELLAYIKSNPGKVGFSSGGIGSLSHLVMELFQQRSGVKLLHVPYRGTAPALNDVLGGHVALMVPDLTIALPQMQKGLLRAYGVTSATRAATAPDIPTLAESGLPRFEADQWFGLAAPAGTPRPIIDKIYAAVKKALNDPDVKQRFNNIAMIPAPSASPDEYSQFVHSESIKWEKVVKEGHIEAQ